MTGLEPVTLIVYIRIFFAVSEPNRKGWIRTSGVSIVTDLQSAAIANYAYFPRNPFRIKYYD